MYNVGDLVKVTNKSNTIGSHLLDHINLLGYVCHVTNIYIGIDFGKQISNGHGCDGKCADEQGYYHKDYEIELIVAAAVKTVSPSFIMRSKVKVIIGYSHLYDEIGTICNIETTQNGNMKIYLDFGKQIPKGHNCEGHCPTGQGWIFYSDDLETVSVGVDLAEPVETETDWRNDRYNFYKNKGWL